MANRFLVGADGIDEPSWLGNVEPFLQKMAAELGFDGQEASIVFCGDEMIRELNKNYRNIDAADTLKKNAEYFGIDENSELKRLLLHGLLHLNGYDHGEEHIEKGKAPECEMLKLQEEILLKYEGEKII